MIKLEKVEPKIKPKVEDQIDTNQIVENVLNDNQEGKIVPKFENFISNLTTASVTPIKEKIEIV